MIAPEEEVGPGAAGEKAGAGVVITGGKVVSAAVVEVAAAKVCNPGEGGGGVPPLMSGE